MILGPGRVKGRVGGFICRQRKRLEAATPRKSAASCVVNMASGAPAKVTVSRVFGIWDLSQAAGLESRNHTVTT